VLVIDLIFPVAVGAESPSFEPWTAIHRWEQAIVEKVRGFGGILLQRVSTLLIVAFGVPRALEQMPQRAVQAALAVQQLVTEAQSAAVGKPTPGLRQVVHLGAMLVETQAGALTERYLAEGDTLSLTVRLLGHASAGELLVSPQIGRLVAGWCKLQARALPLGTEVPGHMLAYRVEGLARRHSPPVGLEVWVLSRFVRRVRELSLLGDLLTQAKGGRGQVVGIVGEAGIGKSRLLYEFRCSLVGRQIIYLESHCLSYGSAMPYLPVLELLRDSCGITEIDAAEAMAEKVHVSLRAVGIDPAQGAPYVLHLLGVLTGTERLAELSPEVLKARIFETVRQLCLHVGRPRPLLLTIEDLHWVDQTSAEFFTSLVERVNGACTLVLTTYRPGYQPPWAGKSYVTQLALALLSEEDSFHVVHSALQTAEVSDLMARPILVKAEGNPFFIEELVQALVDQGIFVREPGGIVKLGGPLPMHPLAEIQLPPTLQGVLASRIDRLNTVEKMLLQSLAVAGNTCSWGLLTEMIEQPAGTLQRLLGRLQDMEFIYEQPTLLEPEYTFKHVLTQEAAYHSLPVKKRRELHERTAQAIEGLYSHRLEEHYSELAHHYSRSGNTAKALDYLQRAGHQAVQRSAHVEAISHLTKGLELLTSIPDTRERIRQELDLQIAIGPALMATKGYAALEVEHAYARARALCLEVGETPQLFSVLRGLWSFYATRGELEAAHELGEQLLHMAQQGQDPALLLEAYQALGLTLVHLGELALARVHLEQGIALYDPQHHHSHTVRFAQDPGVICLGYLSEVLWYLGYPDQALQRSQEALALACELAHPFSLAFAWDFAGALYYFLRDGPAVQERAEAAIALASEQGFILWRVQGKVLRGWGLTEQGWGEEGIAQMCGGLAAWRAIGAELGRPYYLGMLAEAYAKMGRTEAGLRALAEALAGMHKYGEHYCEAELYRLKGELLLAGSVEQHVEVQACFERALNVAHQQQAKSLELRAATSLSRLSQRQGKRTEAHALLADLYGWFTEGFDTADLQEAKALLEELS